MSEKEREHMRTNRRREKDEKKQAQGQERLRNSWTEEVNDDIIG